MGIAKDKLSTNAMGGTEIMKHRLVKELGEDFLEPFQIFVSRAEEELNPDKIRVYWHQDMPNDPAVAHLGNEGWKKYDLQVFNSHWQMNMFNLFLGVPYSKSVVLLNAIDPFTEDVSKNKSKETIRLIYHSTPHRGLELLVPIFEALCKDYDNIELDVYSSFNIYGWGARDEQYKELFQRCKDHPKINYHGSVPNNEIREALSKAHIFAYPNIWQETSCIALMEAMSAGLVCVHPNYAALYETSCGLTRMYQWTENPNEHANRAYANIRGAIDDVIANRVEMETQTVKVIGDYRHNWIARSNQWRELLTKLLESKKGA